MSIKIDMGTAVTEGLDTSFSWMAGLGRIFGTITVGSEQFLKRV